MEKISNEENRKRKRFGKMRELFEEIQTMRLMNYNVEEMTEILEERHPDEIHFANQYIEFHKNEKIEDIIKQAYELLYSEEPPILKKKEESKTQEVPEINSKTMLELCTQRLIKAFIRDRVELVTELLASGRFNAREFASLGYDREYMECLVRTVKLFSPTREVKREMLQDRKRMNAVIDRVFEDLYILSSSKRTRLWSCDYLDIEGLRKYEEVE